MFDPVLVEIALRWFSPVGGTVLDPFAGGSVRGVVAAKLGRQYIGHELRPEQVEANRAQWDEIDQSVIVVGEPVLQDDFMPELTPVELREPVWIVGDSRNIDKTCHDVQADMLFTCPPYADLEVYSDDPLDISTLDYDQFKAVYREIIAKSCALLKPDRFACIVVGEVRAKGDGGGYRNFVGDTVQAFVDAGLTYYNEAILITPVGSLPMRAGRQFSSSRKLGKTHQNILVFVKGDPKAATLACGDIDVSESLDLIDESDMVDDGNDSQPE